MRTVNLIFLASALASSALFGKEVKVFILSGQSNMVGSGLTSDLGADPQLPQNTYIFNAENGCPDRAVKCNFVTVNNINVLSDNRWRPIQPLNWGFGPEVGFARTIGVSSAYQDFDKYIIKAAWGGTGLHKRIPTEYSEPRYDFNNGLENWVPGGSTSSFKWNSGGTISGNVSGNDPMIISPHLSYRPNGQIIDLSVSSEVHNLLRIRYKNQTAGTTAQIFFKTQNGVWSEENSKTFAVTPNSSSFKEYAVDMSNVPSWNGKLEYIRFDPTTAASGSFEVDFVRIETTGKGRSWEFGVMNTDLSGWTGSAGIANTHFELHYTGDNLPNPDNWKKDRDWRDVVWVSDISGTGAYMQSPDWLGTNIDSSKTLRVGIWNRTSDNYAKITFITNGSPAYQTAKSVLVKIVPNDDRVREYVIDMSANAAWKGKLRQIRIYPSAGGVSGTFGLDYVRFGGSVDESWLNPASDMFPWFTRIVDKALADITAQGNTYTIEGFFWMQGETDATNQTWATNYSSSLNSMALLVRDRYGLNIPFIYGMIRSQYLTSDQYVAVSKMDPANTLTDAQLLNNYFLASSKQMWPYSYLLHQAQYNAQTQISYSRCVEDPAHIATKIEGCYTGNASIGFANCDPAHYGSNTQADGSRALIKVGDAFAREFLDYRTNPTRKGCRNPANFSDQEK